MASLTSGKADSKAVWATRTAIMLRLAREGASYRFIGAVLGLDASTVCRRLQALDGKGLDSKRT